VIAKIQNDNNSESFLQAGNYGFWVNLIIQNEGYICKWNKLFMRSLLLFDALRLTVIVLTAKQRKAGKRECK